MHAPNLHPSLLRAAAALALLPVAMAPARAENRPERLEWFRDQGFGLFIHWSVDSQLGTVISHSMAGASPDYLARFLTELPKTFNPHQFRPGDWAALAKLAGIRYVVFTAKHHSGFCMYDTATTDFGIMHTPFRRDITGEVLRAFREQGIAPGLYFSPDDFWWLHRNGKAIQRNVPEVFPANNPGLLEHDRKQVRELMTKYGPIDVVFFDGPPEGLRELAWEIRPDTVVTRGAIQTPELYIPGMPLEGPWEACMTMGTAWQYQPQNEVYKSGGELIRMLIETRAKGGNLLLNVGPKPDGELPIEQEERLREIALWMFVNGESIHGVRPWVITNEGDYWFTRKRDEDTLYVIVKPRERWQRGTWKEIELHSVRATAATQANVLGQDDRILEYRPDVVPKTTFQQDGGVLRIRAMHAQRLQDNSRWPNPVVVKLTNVQPVKLNLPKLTTGPARWTASAGATLEGELLEMGDQRSLAVAFEYRPIRGADAHERSTPWAATPDVRRTAAGRFSAVVKGWQPGEVFEYRAVARHPLLPVYGASRTFTVQ